MRIRALSFAAALALTLAACGTDSDEVEIATDDVQVATPTLEEGTEDDTTSDEPGDTTDSGADDGTTDDQTTDTETSTDAPDRSTNLLGYEFEVSLEDAIEISDGETGGGTIYQVGMDWSNGAWVWEINTMAGGQQWELDIDATTGEIRESDREDEDDDERQLEFDSVITHTEAMEAAAAEASGSVTQWELDWDDGRQEYNVEFEDDVDVTIDALSGEILEVDN